MSLQRRPGNQPFISSRASLLVVILIMYTSMLVVLIGGYAYDWQWTGVGQHTLWDWLELLVATVTTAFIGFLGYEISAAQYRAQEQHAQDEAVQAYLDEIGQMLLDRDRPLRKSKKDDEVQTLARARTLMVPRRLDSSRKESVVQFLYESHLIVTDSAVIELSGANLTGVTFSAIYLANADLSGADLTNADLRGAVLSRTELTGANLTGANLTGADLTGADLTEARLAQAQLDQAKSLKGITMPNGQKVEE